MSKSEFDYIVIGLGGIGSGVLYWLSKLAPNKRILGLEQFTLGHVKGGSEDFSRIIRKSVGYTDTPNYRSLAADMYTAWEELERETGLQILFKCGGLCFVDSASEQQYNVMKSYYDDVNLEDCQKVDAAFIRNRFPQIKVDSSAIGFYESQAGLADAAVGNAAHQQRALAQGAQIVQNAKVNNLVQHENGIYEVHTSKGVFTATTKVIVACGAWINQVLAPLNVHVPVKVTLENVSYIATKDIEPFRKENFPIIIYKGALCDVYTLPMHGIPCFKIGCDAAGPVTTGDARHWTPDPNRERYCMDWVKKYVPQAVGPIRQTKTCLYTMTNDRHFVIDTLASRGHSNVLLCCGAGHAYKFAAVLGKTLAEMAVDSQPTADISAFRVDRPAITDPTYRFWRDDRMKANI